MLVDLQIKNWMTFQNVARLSTVAINNKKVKHAKLISTNSSKLNILPIVGIYGENGSGKSNLISAIKFIKKLMSHKKTSNMPCIFADNKKTSISIIVFLAGGFYRYDISIIDSAVHKESLCILKNDNLEIIFKRTNVNTVFFNNKTRTADPNKLVLPDLIKYSEAINAIYDWFLNDVVILQLDQEWRLKNRDPDKIKMFNTILPFFGTPIKNLTLLDKKLVAVFKDKQILNVRELSFGTIKILRLIFLLVDLLDKSVTKTYFIDDLDKNLHTLVVEAFIKAYQSYHMNNPNQLIFTSHNPRLINLEPLAIDQIYMTFQKSGELGYALESISDYFNFAINDPDLAKSYLQGRLSGVPNMDIHDFYVPDPNTGLPYN